VAVGQRARLAFRKNGLHAFGGYIEGFLPATFAEDAVASDDRILAFLQRSDATPTLKQGKDRFVLSRGGVEVRFEAAADTPLPTFPVIRKPTLLTLQRSDLVLVEAMLDTVPKTGWGALNPQMLGLVMSPHGTTSTDNTSWASAPDIKADGLVILPRPFCLALLHWADALGMPDSITYSTAGVLATWKDGAKLYGALPAPSESIDYTALRNLVEAVVYVERSKEFLDHLEEAAIFSDDLIVEVRGGGLRLSTPGEISWYREIEWNGDDYPAVIVPLKRFTAAVHVTDEISFADGKVFLRKQAKDLLIVIATKG
jgi:hypothetical protein